MKFVHCKHWSGILAFFCIVFSPCSSGIAESAQIFDQQIQGISAYTSAWPAMVRKPDNLVARIDVNTSGGQHAPTLESIKIDFTETHPEDLDSVTIVSGSQSEMDGFSKPLTPAITKFSSTGPTPIPVSVRLKPGNNHFWVNVRLRNGANPDRKLALKNMSVSINGKDYNIETPVPMTQRIGYAVGLGGDKILPQERTCGYFRIPGIIKTAKGTLVACMDLRYDRFNDLPSDIDVGVSRSTDGGKTWSPASVAIDFRKSIPGITGTGNGDSAILEDKATGRLWIASLWANGINPIFGSHGTNNPQDRCGQFILSYSDDDGITWSPAINITDQVKKPEWTVNFQGPGIGICLKDGTLVFPCQFWKGQANSSVIYSKDHGKTWTCGTSAYPGTSEAQIVELEDGTIMINARNENRTGQRIVCTTRDLGSTWTRHPTCNNANGKGLPEPKQACQGSIIGVKLKGDGEQTLFFSNPLYHERERHHMIIRASKDQGQTWPAQDSLLYDERNGYGYSSLVPIDDEYIGILYEGRGLLFFLRLRYDEILRTCK